MNNLAQAASIGAKGLMWRAIFGICGVLLIAGGGACLMYAGIDPSEETASAATLPARNPALLDVTTWAPLQPGADLALADRSPVDLLVTAPDLGTDTSRSNAVHRLQRRPDGHRRLVLARLPIAEIGEEQANWDAHWVAVAAAAPRLATQGGALRIPTRSAPGWLGDEQQRRRGHYRVRFWQPEWQARLFGSPDASLDRIIAAGFDGVYFSHAELYLSWTREPAARAEMIKLIERVCAYARRRAPGFLIVMENAEDLVGSRRVRSSIDAVAKDGLLNSTDGDEKPNSEGEIRASVHRLKKAQREGLPVLVLETLHGQGAIASARRRLGELGFLAYIDAGQAKVPGSGL